MSSSLLINEHPLQVLPTLAVKIGLNEAIILQQVHYWITNKDKRSKPYERDGRRWVYNTYEEWREQFPFWSVRTIQRHALTLEEKGLLVVEQFDLKAGDARKYYTLNYDRLNELTGDPSRQVGTTPSAKVASPHSANLAPPSRQVGTTIVPTWHHLIGTETSSETNTERELPSPAGCLPILLEAYKNIAKDRVSQDQLSWQCQMLEGEGVTPGELSEWLKSRRSLSSIKFIGQDFRTWKESTARQNQKQVIASTPKKYCGACKSGWLMPDRSKGETHARQCSCQSKQSKAEVFA